MKTAEFGQPCAAVPEHGRCRICRCTRITACDVMTDYGSRACGWTDDTQTLCDAPECIAEAKREIGVAA
jgi:hypothetical protein